MATRTLPEIEFSLRQATGERCIISPGHDPTALEAMDRLVTEAMVDEGDFIYGPKVAALNLPLRNEYDPDRSASTLSLTEFYKRADSRGYLTEGFRVFEGVDAFKRRPEGVDGRTVLLELPYDQWADDNTSNFLADVRELYGVCREEHRLRKDPGLFGTDVYYVFSGEPFLLVERTVLEQDETGKQVLLRRLEAADASNSEAILKVLNELSLGERIRVKDLLQSRKLPDVQRAYALERANRNTIRNDGDIHRLLESRHAAAEERRQRTILVLAAQAISRVIHPFGGRRRSGGGRHRTK